MKKDNMRRMWELGEVSKGSANFIRNNVVKKTGSLDYDGENPLASSSWRTR